MAVAWVLPSIHQADEVYQVAEQATRAIHGYGVVSWEFQTGSRPAFLAVLVEPIYRLHASAAAHQMLAAAVFSLLSLIPVWVAFQWTARVFDVPRGLVAAFMMGTWFELVYFAPKATADMVCAGFFVLGLFLVRPAARTAALLVAGVSLMISLGIRVQIAPAIALIVCAALIQHSGRRAPVICGMLAGLALVGAAEWAWWGIPFRGHWRYLEMEFAHHASTFFGHQPVTFFAKNAVLMYGGALPVIAVLALVGARRAPILLLTFIALVVPFHFVGHKEYRFMMPAVPVMVLLMGIGASDVLSRLPAPGWRTWTAVATAWLVAMVSMSLSDSFRPFWFKDRNEVLAFRDIGAQPDACGVGLERIRWYHTPGYSGLGRDIPIYELMTAEDMRDLAGAVNYIVAATKAPPPPAPFERWRSYSRPLQYVYRRPGGCVPQPAAQIERPPIPVGETQ